MSKSEQPVNVSGRTTTEQIRDILELSGIEHVRRWQELQVSISSSTRSLLYQVNIDSRGLRMKSTANSLYSKHNRKISLVRM
jgi:hypothetical protein